MKIKRILLIVYLPTHFTELIRVARILKKQSLFKPIIFFRTPTYPTFKRDSAICIKEGISYLDFPEGKQEGRNTYRSTYDKIQQFQQYLPATIKTSYEKIVDFNFTTARKLIYPFIIFYQFIKETRLSKILLSREFVNAIVLAEDNIAYKTSIWIKNAHKLGIPSVIVPFTVVNAREAAEAFYHLPGYSLEKKLNILVGFLYPKWVYEHKGQRLLRLPAIHVLVREFMGLSSPMPWVSNSGYADAIAVESEFMLDHYRNQGLPEKQLVFTGALYNDILALNLKNSEFGKKRLYRELNLSSDKGLLLCALPPSQFPRPECDFETYHNLIEFWIKSLLGQDKYHVVVRLHPRIDPDSMKYLEKSGAKICLRDTAEIVPLCDIFVASISATIRWAIACGKPVINYDVYRYRYADYFNVSSVFVMEEKDDFIRAVKRLTSDKTYHNNSFHARQKTVMEHWGLLDGKASQRMLDLLDKLISKSEKENT